MTDSATSAGGGAPASTSGPAVTPSADTPPASTSATPLAGDATPAPASGFVPTVDHRPVARIDAGNDLTLLVVAFGVTVVTTRLFLALAGYPQIGGGTYHIAHALWGGVLLVIGAMLPLLWANHWAFTVAALSAGVGVGLFVDEVGKFITANNDYFFPLAAPIIYVVFLLLLLVARWATKSRPSDARAQFYDVLEGLQHMADGRLDLDRRNELVAHLRLLQTSGNRPELTALANVLTPVVETAPTTHEHSRWDTVLDRLRAVENRLLPLGVVRVLLIIGCLICGFIAFIAFVVAYALIRRPPGAVLVLGETRLNLDELQPALFLASLGEIAVGAALTVAAALFSLRRDRPALRIAYVSLLFALMGVNALLGYVDASTVVVLAVYELALLGLVLRFRHRFLVSREPLVTRSGGPQ